MHSLVLSCFGHIVRMTTVATVENKSHRNNLTWITLICVVKLDQGRVIRASGSSLTVSPSWSLGSPNLGGKIGVNCSLHVKAVFQLSGCQLLKIISYNLPSCVLHCL